MAHQFKIVVENEGMAAPDAYLRMMIAKQNSSFGCASIDADGKLILYRQAEGASMELLHNIRDKYKSFKRYSVFGKSDGQMAEDDVQPYSLLQVKTSEDGDPEDALISFWDGEFKQCAKTDSALAPHFFANEDTLYPMVQLLQEQTQGNLDVIIENIDCDAMVEEVTNLLSTSSNGAVLILGTNLQARTKGSVLMRTIGDMEKEYPWGWVSDHIGFVEQEYPAQDSKLAGKKVLVLKGKSDVKKAEGSQDKKETPKAPGGEPDKKPATPEDPGEGYEFVQPPSDVRGGALKEWYMVRTPNKQLPPKWEDRPSIRVKKSAGPKALDGLRKIPQVDPTSKKDSIPVISEAELKNYDNEFVKGRFRDSTGKPVPNPFTYKDFEGKLPTFTEAMAGLGVKDISDVYSWPPVALQFLVEKCPMLVVNLLMQLIQTAANQAQAKETKVEEPKPSATGGVSGRRVLNLTKKAG